jgi:hypothetical protein
VLVVIKKEVIIETSTEGRTTMDNSAIMSGTFNEPGITGLVRPPEPRPQTKDVVARQSEKNGGVDIVELSGESIQLTRAAAQNQTEQAAPAGIAQNDNNPQSNPESNNFNISTLRGILTTIEESGTTTTGTAATDAILNPGATTQTDLNTLRQAELVGGTPQTDLNIPKQAEPVSSANPPAQETNATTLDTTKPAPTGSTASTIETPTERAQAPANAEANKLENEKSEGNRNTLEGEANELTKFNTVFNISNGLQTNNTQSSNTMNTSDVVQAQQPSQYSQQMLLQNLSSQIAQTVPPASVISVVG